MGRANSQELPGGWAGELADLFRRLKKTSGLNADTGKPPTLRQIAQRSGYAPSHVRDILNGTGRPSTDAVLAVAGALNASAEDRRLAAFYAEQIRRRPAERRTASSAEATLPVPRELPHGVRGFTGREEDLARLHQLATADAAAGTVLISAIDGAAGVGKTALALCFAHRVADRFPDGQLHVNLRGFDPHQPPLAPGDVLDQFLRSLGIDPSQIPSSVDERARLYRSVLAGKRVLILLDNAGTAEQVRPLLPACHTCLTLVTSRNRLSGLVALDGAHRVAVDVLTTTEAVALLADVAGADRVTAEPGAAAQLAQLTGHLPLALRIVAERLSSRPHLRLRDLANELVDEHDRLNLLSADGDEHMTVRSVFSWSYHNLEAPVARLFRLLGAHAGPDFTAHVAAALLDDTPKRAQGLLDALSAVNLIEQTGRDRYRFHDLLRVYAAECGVADEPGPERAAAVRRLLTWYLHTAYANAEALMPGRWMPAPDPAGAPRHGPTFADQADALRWCEAERANLVAATRQAAELGEETIAWKLPVILVSFFWLRKHWTDWVTTLRTGLAAAERLNDPAAQAWVLTCLGAAHHDVGRVDEALACYRPALDRWRGIGDRLGQAWSLSSLGVGHLSLRQPEHAAELCLLALAIARDIDEVQCEGFVLLCLGMAYQHLCQYDNVVGCARRAVRIWHESGNRYGLGWSLHSLGSAYRHLGRFDEAIDHCREAAAIRRAIGDRRGEASSLVSLGKALRHTGRLEEAREAWVCALKIFETLGGTKAAELRSNIQALGRSVKVTVRT